MNLPAISTEKNKIGIFQLDLAPKLASTIGLDLSLEQNVELIKDILKTMGQVAGSHATGLVIDPVYSLELSADVKNKKTGFLTRLNTLYEEVDPLAIPSLIPNYGLEEIRNNYNLAELELFYHPEEENALAKKQLLAEIHDYCDYLDIALLLKLIVYTPAGQEMSEDNFQQDQLRAIQELRNLTDVISLQYPLDPLGAATITAELDIPWILQTQDQKYEEYKQTLRICLENGAAGFMAGSSLWQELKSFKQEDQSPDIEKIKQFTQTTLQDRVIELMRILNET